MYMMYIYMCIYITYANVKYVIYICIYITCKYYIYVVYI